MKAKRFRISRNDEIKATASGSAGFLSSVYDSQFTTIGEVIGVLIRKIPYYSGKKIEVEIWNITKEEVKNLSVNVNKQECEKMKTNMKNKKRIEKKYVDELKDEYDRLGEIRANRIILGCLVAIFLVLSIIAFKLGLIIIK